MKQIHIRIAYEQVAASKAMFTSASEAVLRGDETAWERVRDAITAVNAARDQLRLLHQQQGGGADEFLGGYGSGTALLAEFSITPQNGGGSDESSVNQRKEQTDEQ